MLQDEYFVIARENNKDYPLFKWNQKRGRFGLGEPVKFNSPVNLRLSDPLSPSFQWADFHKLPDPVFSPRIAEQLTPLEIYGIQLVPAIVKELKRPELEKNYYFLHVWNQISCLDKENSDLELYKDGTIFSIEKLVLDEKTLREFELSRRLIFKLTENTSVTLFHESIKDLIMASSPTGVRFIKATDWYSDIVFD